MLYPVAPETSFQSNVAEEDVILIAPNPEAIAQVVAAEVVNVADDEKALVAPPEQTVCTWN